MKSEVWRVSGKTPPRRFSTVDVSNRDPHHSPTDGTLRWQAPELMAGGNNKFVASMDVYAFAICSVEILNKGNLPWPLLDDDAVRRIVLSAFTLISLDHFLISDCLFFRGQRKTRHPKQLPMDKRCGPNHWIVLEVTPYLSPGIFQSR